MTPEFLDVSSDFSVIFVRNRVSAVLVEIVSQATETLLVKDFGPKV